MLHGPESRPLCGPMMKPVSEESRGQVSTDYPRGGWIIDVTDLEGGGTGEEAEAELVHSIPEDGLLTHHSSRQLSLLKDYWS